MTYFFLHKYIFHIIWKECNLFDIWFLWFLICHNMKKKMKILWHYNDMVEIQTLYPYNTMQCIMLWYTFFYINIFFTSYEKNVIYLTFDFFGFWFAIIWGKKWKSFDIIMMWLKFKPCTLTKQCNVLCDNNFDSLIICFYPQIVVLNVFLTLPNVLQHFLFYLMASHFSSLVQCLIIPQYPPIVCDFFPLMLLNIFQCFWY